MHDNTCRRGGGIWCYLHFFGVFENLVLFYEFYRVIYLKNFIIRSATFDSAFNCYVYDNQ